MSQQPRLTYRPDIDGLRAIAVLAVIGFHASPRFVPGGFVGVDVFFVISGFLISGILFAQASAERFSFADFYARRVRRIFPALAVVLVGCWAIGWLVLVGGEYRQLEKHIAAGATFLSNFLLWGESGYFDAAAESKPLLHLWSLGVEEQFYLMWPPILYFCWKRGLNMVTAIVTIVAGSFLLNVSLVGWNAIAAFYAPLTRLWELLLGGLLAYGELFHRARITSAVNEVVFVSVDRYDDRFVANLKAGLGLTLIALAVALLGKNAAYPGWWFSAPAARPFAVAVGLADGALYPGWWALLPVVGTALLIWAGPDAAINRRLLALRVLVYIGLISYPLYLWHWPLLSFARIMESGEAPRSVRAAAIGIAFILAAATYEAVERPIRRGVSRRTPLRLATVAAALAVVASISFYSYETDAFTSRTPQFATAVDPPMRSPRHDPRCGERFPTEGEYCQEYAPGLPVTAALIGNRRWPHASSDWREPPVLWLALVGASSCGKSPAQEPVLDLVNARLQSLPRVTWKHQHLLLGDDRPGVDGRRLDVVDGDTGLLDPGFESPNVAGLPYGLQYDPTGSAWTFSSAAGVTTNGSAFTFANPSNSPRRPFNDTASDFSPYALVTLASTGRR